LARAISDGVKTAHARIELEKTNEIKRLRAELRDANDNLKIYKAIEDRVKKETPA
jgi:hypothetical protein